MEQTQTNPVKVILDQEKVIQDLQSQLKDKSILFDQILESTMAGYWDWLIEEDYEYLSPSFKKMFGYEDHELENNPETWQKLIHPDDLPIVLENFRKHVETKGLHPYNNEVRYFHKNGSIIWVICKGKVVEWDAEGNPVRMVGSHVDITELKNVQGSLASYVDNLESKNQELEQYTYVASHDLQEPLRTISSYAKLLKRKYKDKLDEDALQYLKFMNNAAGRMTNLINGLLDYSRLGRTKEEKQVNCNEILSDILEDLSQAINEKSVSIQWGKLPVITGYEMEIRSLFQNLINNAIKFCKKDVAPEIIINYKWTENKHCFSVKDNGIGIAQENMSKIFGIFQRLHLQREYKGSGIGLAYCKKIVELHKGRIWVESVSGEGCNFRFFIRNITS